jgi:hypothetical protein
MGTINDKKASLTLSQSSPNITSNSFINAENTLKPLLKPGKNNFTTK